MGYKQKYPRHSIDEKILTDAGRPHRKHRKHKIKGQRKERGLLDRYQNTQQRIAVLFTHFADAGMINPLSQINYGTKAGLPGRCLKHARLLLKIYHQKLV